MTFQQVAPGVLVSGDFTVKIPHPDPCWVMENKTATDVIAAGNGKLLIFSTEERLAAFMEAMEDLPVDEIVSTRYTWDALVDKHGTHYPHAVVDHTSEAGFYKSVPLQKGI
jgi:hypothetical protein